MLQCNLPAGLANSLSLVTVVYYLFFHTAIAQEIHALLPTSLCLHPQQPKRKTIELSE